MVGKGQPSNVQVHPTTAQKVRTIRMLTHGDGEGVGAIYMR